MLKIIHSLRVVLKIYLPLKVNTDKFVLVYLISIQNFELKNGYS